MENVQTYTEAAQIIFGCGLAIFLVLFVFALGRIVNPPWPDKKENDDK